MTPSALTELVPGLPLRFPVEVRPPRRFRADRLETWPKLEGRFEFHQGRLLYMPPCADTQSDVVFSINATLAGWLRRSRGFVAGTNEAGMMLAGSVRAADVAVWRRDSLTNHVPGTLRRVAPVLAVEVAGQDEDAAALREKAQWYLDHGVQVVWLVFPDTRSAEVVTIAGAQRCTARDRIPRHAALPGLAPAVRSFFAQQGR